jgi:hypothetical protein
MDCANGTPNAKWTAGSSELRPLEVQTAVNNPADFEPVQ